MKQYFTLVCCFVFACTTLSAQIAIKGTVVDAHTQAPRNGASIYDLGTTNGALTQANGSFELNVKSDSSILVFSYIGYERLEISVAGNTTLTISLQEATQSLDQVVVTALGIERQQRELGFSTEAFDGDELTLSNAPNVLNALSGKSAGVQITTPNGVDGGTTRIVIRGNNNITANNQPLIVVDGVPLENNPGLEDIGRGVDWGSAINNLNPDDIESINILKGPTAAALYGARGANGVVLITTKRGQIQDGIGIQYAYSFKLIQPFRYRD
ncbi:MAG: carboxypeptidase-like regulatory domain-containing protein, partial [Bacteroidota bacterium]